MREKFIPTFAAVDDLTNAIDSYRAEHDTSPEEIERVAINALMDFGEGYAARSRGDDAEAERMFCKVLEAVEKLEELKS